MVSDGDWQILTDKHKKRLGTETKGDSLKSSDYKLMGITKTSILKLSLVAHDRSQVCTGPHDRSQVCTGPMTGAGVPRPHLVWPSLLRHLPSLCKESSTNRHLGRADASFLTAGPV